ncbi:MAG TPA: phage holin family protein [Desulfobaccales bacterium]|nr:phage holin family protein [Desulfobaccales bacterium]
MEKIASDSAALVRTEISLAKQEIGRKLADLQYAIIMLVAGMVFGILAFMTFCAAMIIAISTLTGPGIATCVIGVGLAIIAIVTASLGLTQIRKTT